MPCRTPPSSLISFLQKSSSYGLPRESVIHRETHTSHLFLVNGSAYKLKKALHLDFIDSREPLKRREFCLEEVRLNRRFAPTLYEEVVGIGQRGDGSYFLCTPEENCVDFLVKMRRFPDDALLESRLHSNPPSTAHLEQFAASLAHVHLMEQPCTQHPAPRVLERYLRTNAEVLRTGTASDRVYALLAAQLAQFAAHEPLMTQRCAHYVKRLHGDLHTRNICTIDDQLVAFDGIEFNSDLNTIDTMADLSFLVMDLLRLGATTPLSIIISAYLRLTSDYWGLCLLPLLVSYRAAVRAKVALLAADHWDEQAEQYLSLAERSLTYRQPTLYAIGGLSGAGKSTVAHLVARSVGGIVIRSDFVRKELFGGSDQETAPPHAYTESASHDVYHTLITRAAAALRSGLPVVVDATFIRPSHQRLITALGATLGARCVPLWCYCAHSTALERMAKRVGDPSDATGAVRAAQEERATAPLGDWIWMSTEGTLGNLEKRLLQFTN